MALRAHFDKAAGMPGPQPFVSFRFFIYTDDQSPFLGLSHQILVHAAVDSTTTPIGAAYLPGSHRFERSGADVGRQVTAVLPIELSTMRWLEQQRAGRGGVTFYFDWYVLGHTDVSTGGAQPLQNEVVSLAIGGTPFPVSLPQEVWIDILHDVRYRDVAIVEIPLTADEQNPMVRAHEHLETARERLYRADDRGVLVACGEALDVLPNARRVKLSKEYGYEHLVQELVAPIFDSDRKAERLGRLLTGLRQMCLSGKHDEATFDGRPIPVDHQDAMLAFLMTSAAIAYLEQLPLQERAGIAPSGGIAPTRTPRRRSRRARPAGADSAQVEAAAPLSAGPPLAAPSRPVPAPAPVEPEPAPAAEAAAPAPRRRRWRIPRPKSSPEAG
jgi:hypothetical protein